MTFVSPVSWDSAAQTLFARAVTNAMHLGGQTGPALLGPLLGNNAFTGLTLSPDRRSTANLWRTATAERAELSVF